MSNAGLDVFALRDQLVADYQKFATSFTSIRAADLRGKLDDIYAGARYWPEPLLQINPNFKRGSDVAQAVADGLLTPGCETLFRTTQPLTLFKHQELAIMLAKDKQSYVVTTGTGSGKSLCFFIPIVSAILAEKARDARPRTRAIIIYPMNALANSQLEEINKFLANAGATAPISVARYTGQESQMERDGIAENPPDILLTNFMMLELLMTRQNEVDRRVMENCRDLRFLVLDELHTYRGRQGADVALLVRRVRERLSPSGQLLCIGTSATMASEGSVQDRNQVVAQVASKLFAAPVSSANIVSETLDRATDPAQSQESIKPLLRQAVETPLSPTVSDAELKQHPLAIWVETSLGMTWSDVDTRWNRAHPLTLTEAVTRLTDASGAAPEACKTALRQLLLVSSVPERQRCNNPQGAERAFFAFKLHQFISGARHLYATFELPGARLVTVDGQAYAPEAPEKRLYSVHFCRNCGQDYHPVKRVGDENEFELLPRDIDEAPPFDAETGQGRDAEVFGFALVEPQDEDFTFANRPEDYPDSWLETDKDGHVRLKADHRKTQAQACRVTPDGQASGAGPGVRAWFVPGRFRACLRCKDAQSGAARDRNRLASLSAEGRSSATTVLVSSALRWMHQGDSGMPLHTRKLLGFTDNRQDAALQAGHFNDFLFVSLIRAGMLGALQAAGAKGVRSSEMGDAMWRALGFAAGDVATQQEWLLDPSIRGLNKLNAEETFKKVLAYRAWHDQRRGWRYTNPNLEDLQLLSVSYLALDELAADDEIHAEAPPVLRNASHAVRAQVYQRLFDTLRQGLAVRSSLLERPALEQLLRDSHGWLRTPWGFAWNEYPPTSRWLMLEAPARKANTMRDEELLLRGGPRSTLGRRLREASLWAGDTTLRDMKSKDLEALTLFLLNAAKTYGLVSQEPTPFDNKMGWRLIESAVVFHARTPATNDTTKYVFFQELYANLAHVLAGPQHPFFGFEAREHTAQVDGARRAVREQRFRWEEKERDALHNAQDRLKEIGEAARFLPVLFCSPTMELGVDISALNAVYLRNVPPTPANYAQRSGRAGRSGQAALVLTYCAAQSPHDQYFFNNPRAMVHGEVRPPLLDLANQDMVQSHMQAVWLASTAVDLPSAIAELLELDTPKRPIKAEKMEALRRDGAAAEARQRIERVLTLLEDDLTEDLAPWYPGSTTYAAQVVASALENFNKAFSRWRELMSAAEQQRNEARNTMDDYAGQKFHKDSAKVLHAQAIAQLDLLQAQGDQNTDFYTYRYLATEGFLPGYNFPRLPLIAFIPAHGESGGRQTYLQRPRFLALAEFGPRSLVYHEGRVFRVEKVLLTPDSRTGIDSGKLPTTLMRICSHCGAGHPDEKDSFCHACGGSLSGADIIHDMYEISNVGTRPALRITANDEERQRQGFELQTTFAWAPRGDGHDARNAEVRVGDEALFQLTYAPRATISRINKGLRRRKNRTQFGFRIDPVKGYWEKADDDDDTQGDPTAAPKQWIVPFVKEAKNALLVMPEGGPYAVPILATLQHALLRGIEATFQLEQGEILAEPVPAADRRKGFLLYEATEGGAGVLTRLVREPQALAQVARQALVVLHFALGPEDPPPASTADLRDATDNDGRSVACVAACYRCLMSYYNQPDHTHLDRRDETVRDLLVQLTRATTLGLRPERTPTTAAAPAPAVPDAWAAWFTVAQARGTRLPDARPLTWTDIQVPMVWRSQRVAAWLAPVPADLREHLEGLGFEVVAFATPDEGAAFERLESALGGAV